jgi:hypothetical protein
MDNRITTIRYKCGHVEHVSGWEVPGFLTWCPKCPLPDNFLRRYCPEHPLLSALADNQLATDTCGILSIAKGHTEGVTTDTPTPPSVPMEHLRVK